MKWQERYDRYEASVRDLWDVGFRPKSNKYRHAVKEWRENKKHRSETVVLKDNYDYRSFKECEIDIARERYEREVLEKERKEYKRIKYLLRKYGNKGE